MTEEALLSGLRGQDRAVQKWLYDRYSPLFFSICRRYLRNREEAEEALVSGFYKIYTKVEGYSGTGNFEGWMRKIMVNEALMQLRRRQPLVFPGDTMPLIEEEDGFNIVSELTVQEIMKVVEELPVGYRTVFNLFVLEGYKHHEIAEALQISINTSKSQLILAKDKMRKLLRSKGYL